MYFRLLRNTLNSHHTHTNTKRNTHAPKDTCSNNNNKSPMPMGTIICHSPHPPTCVWVGWVFIYFSSMSCFCCTSCFHCMRCFHCTSCFHCHFCCSFDRCLHPPHPIHLVVVQSIPISPSICVQYCSCCLHGVK